MSETLQWQECRPDMREKHPIQSEALAQPSRKSYVFQEAGILDFDKEDDSLEKCLEKVWAGDMYRKSPAAQSYFREFLDNGDFKEGDEFVLDTIPGTPVPDYNLSIKRNGETIGEFHFSEEIRARYEEMRQSTSEACKSGTQNLRNLMTGTEQIGKTAPERIFREAEKYLWIPYGKKGMDCSHFVSAVCRDCWAVPRDFYKTSAELHKMADPVSREDVRPWDLFFFIGTNGCSHVGFVGPGWLRDGTLDVIHASSSAWVCHKTEGLRSLLGGCRVVFGRLPFYDA